MDNPRSPRVARLAGVARAAAHARYLVPAVAGFAILLAACLTDPAEPHGTSPEADTGTCSASQRFYNGACHTVCTTSTQCAGPETCMTVASDASLCLDYSSCAYLGDDTECGGVPFNAYGYPTGYDPYVGPDYPYDYAYPPPSSCTGNATYQTAPPRAGDDPKCGEAHTVTRCQKNGGSCQLVSVSTIDIAEK
ncbi:MAG: hypothetical protein JWP97_6031 [Labilithrix sp.]|nr:hypothetical protein [Labilithrix sp.]